VLFSLNLSLRQPAQAGLADVARGLSAGLPSLRSRAIGIGGSAGQTQDAGCWDGENLVAQGLEQLAHLLGHYFVGVAEGDGLLAVGAD
jgi:hypothetical protein